MHDGTDRVVVARPLPHLDVTPLTGRGLDVAVLDGGTEALADAVSNAIGLVVAGEPVTRELIAGAPRLRVISQYGIGVDTIDLVAAAEAGVVVTNLPDLVTDATAELTLALLLACTRRVVEADRAVRAAGRFPGGDDPFLAQGAQGRRLGIVGAGRIARRVAVLATAVGMELHHWSRRPSSGLEALGSTAHPDPHALCTAVDVLTVHVPRTSSTHHLIGADELAALGTGGVVLNTARGGIIDEDALCAALADDRLAAVGMDVTDGEPAVRRELIEHPRTVITPHVGTSTDGTRRAMSRAIIGEVTAVVDGRAPRFPVMLDRPTHDPTAPRRPYQPRSPSMSSTAPAPSGANLIAGVASTEGSSTFQAADPSTATALDLVVTEAAPTEVARAVAAAVEAHAELSSWSGSAIAGLLRACSEELMALGDELITTAMAETGLAEARLVGERARTCAQLELFADHVATGAHLDVIIDHPDPDMTPPRPDLRRMRVGVGPVAVFGASNFPFAFSVPGGDTASALAAGCPVVVKAHPSHPTTSELAGRAITRAVERVGAPAGTFSLVQGRSEAVGQALVLAEGIRAVGFTGSARGGRALCDLAAGREHPIPVHAEMGSTNPVFVTPGALADRGEQIATALVGSLTMGVGQFCTSPGLVFVPAGDDGDRFVAAVASALSEVEPAPMLNGGIRDALAAQLADTVGHDGVELVVDGTAAGSDAPPTHCAPTLLSVDLPTWASVEALREEHFGPVAVIVRHPEGAATEAVEHLEGQLTATIHLADHEADDLIALRDGLVDVVGRIVVNGFPTGVAVTAAQHHGGPSPATNDARFTSVGTTAIDRFLRPIVFQDAPQGLLPRALWDANPDDVPQRVDGSPTS